MLEVIEERDRYGRACGLKIIERAERTAWAEQAHGAYLLRTNCPEQDPVKLWRWYMQLTQAEDAFRTSKSDLSLCPVFHHKTERVEAHILVCFLSLALWRTLEMWMSGTWLDPRRAPCRDTETAALPPDAVSRLPQCPR